MKKLEESPRIVAIEKEWKLPIKNMLRKWHWEENLTHREIGEKLNAPRATITRWFKAFKTPSQSCSRTTNRKLLNIELTKIRRLQAEPKIKPPPRWHVNTKFFKKWSNEMAYVLGFFTADGAMTINPRGAHFLDFHITDKDLIFKIREILGSNHKIRVRKREGNRKIIYRLQIGSKEMFNDLLKLGIRPRKSLTITLPKIPNKYLRHFVRGYFDGDGSIFFGTYKRKDRKTPTRVVITSFISGSKKILEELHNTLHKVAKLHGGTLYHKTRGFQLSFSINDSLELYKFMYKDVPSSQFLERKYNTFQKASNYWGT